MGLFDFLRDKPKKPSEAIMSREEKKILIMLQNLLNAVIQYPDEAYKEEILWMCGRIYAHCFYMIGQKPIVPISPAHIKYYEIQISLESYMDLLINNHRLHGQMPISENDAQNILSTILNKYSNELAKI